MGITPVELSVARPTHLNTEANGDQENLEERFAPSGANRLVSSAMMAAVRT